MDRKSTIAAQHVNMVDRIETAPRTMIPVATMITITEGRTTNWRKARIVDFSRRMNDR